MKKTIFVSLMFILAISLVLAQGAERRGADDPVPALYGAEQGNGGGEGVPEPMLIAERIQNDDEIRPMLAKKELRTKALERLQPEKRDMFEKGLSNAMTRVQNENAKEKLQANYERFQEKYSERLGKLERVEIKEMNEETGRMKIKAKEEVRFLGFIKAKATKTFEVDEEGTVVEKKSWYRFLYKKAKAANVEESDSEDMDSTEIVKEEAADVVEELEEETETEVESTCANSPSADYCAEEETLAQNGEDENGCAIWTCVVAETAGDEA